MSNPKTMREDLKRLKLRWNLATKQYVDTYPDFATGINKAPNSRAMDAVLGVMKDVKKFKGVLTGNITGSVTFLNETSKMIKTTKDKYNNSKLSLQSELAGNKAGKPMKINKYNENGQSYIYTSYYVVGILSMSFFIYKQLKQ
jgi:hypothetical protein